MSAISIRLDDEISKGFLSLHQKRVAQKLSIFEKRFKAT